MLERVVELRLGGATIRVPVWVLVTAGTGLAWITYNTYSQKIKNNQLKESAEFKKKSKC